MTDTLRYGTRGNNSTLFVIFIIIISMLPMSIYLDTVQASTSGDLGIISSAPEDNSIIPSYESVFFGVTIKNFHSQISPSRIIHWDVCLGNRAANS